MKNHIFYVCYWCCKNYSFTIVTSWYRNTIVDLPMWNTKKTEKTETKHIAAAAIMKNNYSFTLVDWQERKMKKNRYKLGSILSSETLNEKTL